MKVVYSLSKGQLLSLDLLISITIFTLILAILVSQISYNSKEIIELREQNKMLEESYRIGEIFFREGYPENWNESNVEIIGLATTNRIDWNKLKKLENLGYQRSLVLLGLDYDYNITIQGNNINWSFGENPSNAKIITKIDRIGILNSTMVTIQVLVFKYV